MANVASPPEMVGGASLKFEESDSSKLQQSAAHSHRVLTPPTSEDMDKHDGNSSELSDLDDVDDDDIGEIKPDHYWDEENGGRIPVFKPTMDQFRSFKKFVDKIDKYGMKSGIVKVIPPPEWRNSLPTLEKAIKKIKVKNPITQEFAGTCGKYTQANIEKQRSYSLPQWKTLTMESNHQPPAKRGERRREAAVARPKPARPAASSPVTMPDGQRRRPGRPRKTTSKSKVDEEPAESVEADLQVPPTPTSPERADREEEEEEPTPAKASAKPGRKPGAKVGSRPRGRQPTSKSVSSRRMNNQQEFADIDEESFKDFDYHLAGVEDFTEERCRELEDVYWKTLNYGTPMYGADMPGSLFDERTTSWNVAHLENLLDVLGTKVPGVNTAYLYLGMWKATFAWHLEDVDLYSINYIHFGAPKQWYSISQEDARRFETAMRTLWSADYKHCNQFLRHKTYLISPEKLMKEFNIKVNKLVHYEGEFVITYPYGYHSGFNLGYNCAESVNFATEPWLEFGRIAKKCECEADSVWVDVGEIERKLRGEPTPEYYEVTDDEWDGEEVAINPTPQPVKTTRKKASGPKRKREVEVEAPRRVKRIKIMVRPRSQELCVLCPNDVKYDVLLPTDTGKQAHRLCALYSPETYLVEEGGKVKVCGVTNINKARLDLKCNYCGSKRGSCFQCDARKCTRAFHATCAAAAGVLVDIGPVPVWDVDGTEYYCEGFDFRCRFHRPRRPKHVTVEMLEGNKLVREYAKTVKTGEIIQAMMLSGDVFAGVVVENRPSEGCVVVDVEAGGDRVEVEYKYLLTMDPNESQRAKPSPEAKLLPDHLSNNKNVNTNNRQDGVPEIGDAFLDPNSGHKWQEWNTATTAEIRNSFQAKTNVSKADQIWHYLGKTSTEARAQFTSDPKIPVHNPKSSFLDAVKPPPIPKSVAAPQRTHNLAQTPAVAKPSGPYVVSRSGYSAPYPAGANRGTNSVGYGQKPAPQAAGPQNLPSRSYEYKPKEGARPIGDHIVPYSYGSPGYQRIQIQPAVPNYAAPSRAPSHSTYSSGPTSHAQASTPKPRAAAPGAHSPTVPYRAKRQDNSPPYPNFYSTAEQMYSRQPTLENKYRKLDSPKSVTPRSAGVAPVANMLRPAVTNSFAPLSQRGLKSPEAMNDYLSHIRQYPYLLNSFLRRPPTYISPYAAGVGFTEEYQNKLQPVSAKPEESEPSSPQNETLSQLLARQQASALYTSNNPTYASSTWSRLPSKSRSPFGEQNPVSQQLSRSRLGHDGTSQNQDLASSATQSGHPKYDYLIDQITQGLNHRSGSSTSFSDGQGRDSGCSTAAFAHESNRAENGSPKPYGSPPLYSAVSQAPQPYTLPAFQPRGYSGHSDSPGTTRRSSGGHPGGDVPTNQANAGAQVGGNVSMHHPNFGGQPGGYASMYQTSSGGQPGGYASSPYFSPPPSHSSHTRSPERPDYSPLSDVATPDRNTMPNAHTSMHVQDILNRPSSQQSTRGKDLFPAPSMSRSQEQQSFHQQRYENTAQAQYEAERTHADILKEGEKQQRMEQRRVVELGANGQRTG